MNNKEWLYSLEPHELTEWFDAEHTSNDTLGVKKVVSAESVDANDANAASLKGLSDDTQNVTDNREIAETSNNSEADVTDNREKLEADIEEYLANEYGCIPGIVSVYDEWLDRQAAITEREREQHWLEIVGASANCNLELTNRIAELQAKVDELINERDYWKLHTDLWAEKCKEAERERELYRARVSDLLDAIQEAWRVGNLDYSVVDMDGEVVS